MDPRLAAFVAETRAAQGAELGSAAEWRRRLLALDWADAVVIGGATLAEALAGAVTDADLDPTVVRAFHLQYPHQGSLVEKLQELHDDPEALRGLLNGVQGKLFELLHVEALNAGGLAAGWSAELAASPTQPGYDVLIRDAHGEVAELRQLKFSDDDAYLREAFERHPEIDVVVPEDAYARLLEQHPEWAEHLISGGVETAEVLHPVAETLPLAVDAVHPDLVPELALAFIGVETAVELLGRNADGRRGEIALHAVERAKKAVVAGAAGGIASSIAGPWLGVPVSIGVRLALTRREVEQRYRACAAARVARLQVVAERLALPRPPPLASASEVE